MANTEAKALRTRRQEQTQRQQARKIEENTPVAVGASEPSRKRFVLGDPTEPRVAEMGGMGYEGAGLTYRVAECDVMETIYPAGCVTPVTRVRWRKGQHVPPAVYDRWRAEQVAAEQPAPIPESGVPAE